MSDSSKNNKEDLSGRDRIVSNVLTSWGGHLIFIITGFLMPRFIDEYVGQVLLGVWDFSWSFISYLNFMGLGVGSSVNRYVAKYRSNDDSYSLNGIMSSVVMIQFVIAWSVFIGAIVIVVILPRFFSASFGDSLHDAQWVVLLLGTSLAVHMAFDSTRGIITGCHRWDIHNAIHTGSQVASSVFMIIALVMGGSLIHMAVIYLSVTVITEMIRLIYARKLCPEIKFSIKRVTKGDVKKSLSFGTKTIISGASGLIVYQTTVVIIAAHLGPLALAVFSRSAALVKHVRAIISKLTFLITPIVGSLQQMNNPEELKKFFILMTRYSMAFSLPLIVILAIYGDYILKLWMGDAYANRMIIVIFSIGGILNIAQDSSIRVLMGLNKHGMISVLNVVVIAVLYAIGVYIITGDEWQLSDIAYIVVIPQIVGSGILVPLYTCKVLKISYWHYINTALIKPIIICLPYIITMGLFRIYLGAESIWIFILSLLVSFLVLLISYWNFLLPIAHRKIIMVRILKRT